MDSILAIFLSLHVLTSPGTYNLSQIDSFEIIYSQPIHDIQTNTPLLNTIMAEYLPETDSIIIIDDTGS